MAVLMLGTVSSFDIFNTVSLPVGFGQALIASLAFFLTPAPSKVNIASNVVGVLCDNVPSYVHDDGSKGLFVKRVDEMRGMFEDLARGMAQRRVVQRRKCEFEYWQRGHIQPQQI